MVQIEYKRGRWPLFSVHCTGTLSSRVDAAINKKSVFIDVSDIKQDVGGAVDHLLPRKANFNERTSSSGLKV